MTTASMPRVREQHRRGRSSAAAAERPARRATPPRAGVGDGDEPRAGDAVREEGGVGGADPAGADESDAGPGRAESCVGTRPSW